MEYQQLVYEERIRIQALFNQPNKITYVEIGRIIGKDPTCISRELKRNSVDGVYFAKTAQRLYCARKAKNVKRVFDDHGIRKLVRILIVLRWSPEQISGRLKLFNIKVSTETIYSWIYLQKKNKINFLQYLRINKKRNKRGGQYKKRAINKEKKSIHDRPEIVKDKSRIGDWEGDTVEGKKSSGFITTLVDRKSKVLVAAKMENKLAQTFNKACQLAFSVINKIKTITFDNGSEMSNFVELEELLECDIYFADPGSPGQRGLNENTNGLLRQYFPKGYDFTKINQKDVDKAVSKLNNRPRKSLGYKTPLETYFDIPPAFVITALQL